MKLATAIARLTPKACYYGRTTVFISAANGRWSKGPVALQNAIKRLQAHPERVYYTKTSEGERFYSLVQHGMETRIWFS